MDLKGLLGTKEVKSKDLYWAVVLEPGWVQAGIWEIVDNKAEVISVSPVTPWETDSEIVGASDAALSSAIQLLAEDAGEPTKTVFGVPPSWVDKGQIKDEYLNKIKNICTELSLEASGFVILSEAISHLIKAEEGSPVNAIIAGFGKDYLELSVFILGNLVGTTQVARSVSFFDDVCEGLSRFSLTESLPSRFVIYDGKEGDLEEVREVLTLSNWENLEKIRFLHTPKIEVVSPEKKVTAVSLAGAAEIGGITEIVPKREEEYGEKELSKEDQNLVTPKNTLSAEEMGFVVGEDVGIKKPSTHVNLIAPVSPAQISQTPPDKVKIFESLKKKVRNFFSKFSKITETKAQTVSKKKNPIIVGSLAGAVVLVFLILWIFIPKAKVKVYVFPKRFEEKIETTVLKGSGSMDISSRIISGEISSVEVGGEKTKSTTGAKKVGEKAKGSVNIQNGTDSILKLSQGTLLTAANNLNFVLTQSASISAALSPSTPGTQVVEVAAADIGAEYNLAKNEVFSVGDYSRSEVDAIATTDFGGGSSRDISAVSSEDVESLLANLVDELSQKAKGELTSGVAWDKYLIEESFTATPSSKIFSSKVGDEASNLKLSLTLKGSAIYVSKSDLMEISQDVLKNSMLSGFYLDPENIDYSFEILKDLSSTSSFNLNIKADFLPTQDLKSLTKEISGKNIPSMENILSRIPGYVRTEAKIVPRFPWIFGNLPVFSKNITIEILGEK